MRQAEFATKPVKRRCGRAMLLAVAHVILSATTLPTLAATPETIVFMRHGEKPDDANENGQLTCQGQNRALALPGVLLSRYGTPNFIFAPIPESNTSDSGLDYYSMRPLTTIQPTAVQAAVPIRLDFKTKNIDDLQKELMKSAYANALVFVAWEHTYMDELVGDLVAQNGGDASQVPAWPDEDFDSLFIVSLNHGGSPAVTFTIEHEGLDGQSTICEETWAQRERAVQKRNAPPNFLQP